MIFEIEPPVQVSRVLIAFGLLVACCSTFSHTLLWNPYTTPKCRIHARRGYGTPVLSMIAGHGDGAVECAAVQFETLEDSALLQKDPCLRLISACFLRV